MMGNGGMMGNEQKDIYYIAAESVSSAKKTPFLERLLEKDLEVLFLVDPIDEVAVTNLKSYNEKNFVDISKEDLDLGFKRLPVNLIARDKTVGELKDEIEEKKIKAKFGQICDWIKKWLGDGTPMTEGPSS